MSLSKPYALVTLVMKGDRYVPGACVFGYSARRHMHEKARSQVDLVCMVTNDVSQDGRTKLAHCFDHIVEVPYITYDQPLLSTKLFQEKYGSWIKESLTKWNCLGFHQYRRLGFFDADCLVMQDITPALMNEEYHDLVGGCFANAWSESTTTTNGGMLDFYHPYIGKRKPLIIPVITLYQALNHSHKSKMTFVCAGSSLFFQPYAEGCIDFINFCRGKHPDSQIKSLNCGGSGPDDQLIVRFLLKQHPIHKHEPYWQHLHAGWCFIPWKPQLLRSQGLISPQDVFIQHYFNVQKPWEMDPSSYPDLKEWYETYAQCHK